MLSRDYKHLKLEPLTGEDWVSINHIKGCVCVCVCVCVCWGVGGGGGVRGKDVWKATGDFGENLYIFPSSKNLNRNNKAGLF